MARYQPPARSQPPADPGASRLQRVLAYMFAAVIGLSLVCLILIIIAGAIRADIRTGAWPIILVLPMPGLSLAVLVLIALLVVTAVRRSRAARNGNS